jgi:hypothetical protein
VILLHSTNHREGLASDLFTSLFAFCRTFCFDFALFARQEKGNFKRFVPVSSLFSLFYFSVSSLLRPSEPLLSPCPVFTAKISQ